MKKNTILLAALFLLLLGVVYFVSKTPAPARVEALSLPGWKTSSVAKSDDAGFSKIMIKTGANKVVMIRDEEAGAWMITAPVEGEAEGYRVRAILNLFEEPLQPTISRKIPAGKAGRYGLVGEEAIALKVWKKGGDPESELVFVDLVVGRADKSEAPDGGMATERTWLSSSDLGTANLVEGKRIRAALGLSLKELRSRKLLSIKKWSDIDRVVVVRGAGETAERMEVSRAGAEEGAKEEDEKPEKWRFVSPAGLVLGEPRSWFSGLKGLTATEILPAHEAGKELGFEDPAQVARVEIFVGDASVVIRVGREVAGDSWVKLEGKEKEVYKISPYTRKQLLKGPQDLREKRVLGIAAKDDVVGVTIKKGSKGALALEKKGDRWLRVGDGAAVDGDAMGVLLNALVNFRASEFGVSTDGIAAAGFKPPTLSLEIALAGKEPGLRLIFGAEMESKVFARIGRTGEIFKVSAHSRKGLMKSWGDLENRYVFSLEKGDVRRLGILRKGADALRFERETTEADGGKSKEVWISNSEGQPDAKSAQLDNLARTFSRLKAKKTKTGRKAADVGLRSGEGTRVEVETRGGQQLAIHISDERDDDAHFARAEGGMLGKGVFTISSQQAEKLVKDKADLLD